MSTTARRARRPLTVLLGALLVLPLLVVAPAVAAEQPGSCGSEVPEQPAPVVTLPLPDLSPPTGPIVDLAVEPHEGRRLWLTDGWSILRSDDAGCTWDQVFSLAQAQGPSGVDGLTGAIMELAVPQAHGAEDRLYALVQDLSLPSGSSRFRVLVTEDGGESFDLRGQDLPLVNLGSRAERCGDDQPCGIEPSGRLDTVYLRFASEAGTLLHVSTDAASTFEARNSGAVLAGIQNGDPGVRGPLLTDLEVDPVVPNLLWGTSAQDGPQLSIDGGETFVRYEPFEHMELPLTDIRHLDLTHANFGRAVTVVGLDAAGVARVAQSNDDGRTFQPHPTLGVIPGSPTGLVTTDRYVELVATSDGVFTSGRSAGGWVDHEVPTRLVGPEFGHLRHLQAVRDTTVGGPEQVWALNDDMVVRFDVQPLGPPPFAVADVPALDLGAFDPFVEQPQLGVTTGPAQVALAPDEVTERSYRLELPADRISVDVFFLMDATSSMQDEFEALARGIADIATGLDADGVDVQVGLGSYGNGFRYRRHYDIGPVEGFLRELEDFRTGGDGEVAYTALHQTITGTGLGRSRWGKGPNPGKQANWRPNTTRMIVHATDEGLSEEVEGPMADEVLEILRDADVRHLGLIANEFTQGELEDVDTPETPTETQARYDWDPMFELAEVTGTFAPPGGIDCNNDGIVDLQPGEPVACYLSPLTTNENVSALDAAALVPDFADVIQRMLLSQAESSPVSIHVAVGPTVDRASRLLAGWGLDDLRVRRLDLDLRRPQVLRPVLGLRCLASALGTREDVRFTVVSGTRLLGRYEVDVSCGTPSAVAAIAPPAVARGAAVAVQVPPPPPAPIQAPAPAQGAAQANATASANSVVPKAGAAAAKQQQQQAQAATLGRSGDVERDIAYEFTARRDRGPDPALATLAAGVAMTGAAGALARRRRTQTARVRIPS